MNKIQELRREGRSISQIGALTGVDRKTIRKYLADPKTPAYGPRQPRSKMLDGWQAFIQERLAAGVWNGVVLHKQMQERGFGGSYTLVKDYLPPLRKEARRVAVRRFETPPGHQAQVDWGVLGSIQGAGAKKPLYGFVLTLGYSRAMYAAVSLDQSLGSLMRLHEQAFRALGGVPAEILYDNMQTVTLGRDAHDEVLWNPAFCDFARCWGFQPRLCRPYRPQTKGKVESGIGYVRKNFLAGREAQDKEDLDAQLHRGTEETANQSVHGTPFRNVAEARTEERPYLQPLGERPAYPFAPQQLRRVSVDAYVALRSNRYSVPWQAAGKEVRVRLVGQELRIEQAGIWLATHALCGGKHQVITVQAHHAGMPYGAAAHPKKAQVHLREQPPQVHLREQPPQVQVRDLAEYEALAQSCGAEGRKI